MSELTTVARPYAKAAFDFAVEKQAVDKWTEMLAFLAEVARDKTVAAMLTGYTSAGQLADIFIKIGGEQIDEQGQNFIKVMAENGRLVALPAVAEQFTLMREEWQKEVTAEVTSATELSAQQLEAIAASLEQRLARKVKLDCRIDSDLVAGVVIRAGDTVIDGSVRGKLNRLADKLQS
ncbi:F0F1 ATP synthase subunit delta [Ferrimonas lipolytica]|uniref:ATP synthase subunit delta n=1 Tax=Ferrimonas lipolytica TaxID=2724191 RepID=A0A6H1UHZ7_9GAMM|nr:F0F1 ATP synthase subunit delta [Ferrimonas lipolytica]QIZ78230.1 F0F1 ATP synthase subunit delta [Ferrimonas lipolytica]